MRRMKNGNTSLKTGVLFWNKGFLLISSATKGTEDTVLYVAAKEAIDTAPYTAVKETKYSS